MEMNSLKENFQSLSIEDLFNLQKKYKYQNQALNEILFKDVTLIYLDDYYDIYKLLTKTECTGKLSKLTRSFSVIEDCCKFIKKLELIGDLSDIFKTTNFFENFESLELLEIFDKNEIKSFAPEPYTLKLKNLKKLILHFYCLPEKVNHITLDTPSLTWLRFNYNPNKLNILYRHSIEALECDDYLPSIKLPHLKNLFLSLFSNYKKGIFEQFPEIEEIHFLDCDILSFNNIINELNSNGKKLGIYQDNIKINCVEKPLESYSVILDKSLLKIYSKNESNMAKRLHFIKDIRLNFSISKMPSFIFSKLSCISHFKIENNALDDFNSWLKLLQSSQKLGSLRFKTRVNQKFLDALPQNVPMLNRLVIDFELESLEFLKEFKELTYISIEDEFPIEYFKSQIKSHRFVKAIQFCANGKGLTIEFLENEIYFNVLNDVLILKIDDLIEKIDSFTSWNVVMNQMSNFLEQNYKDWKNLFFKIELEPEIQFQKIKISN